MDQDITLDLQRAARIGFDEAIFCSGKTVGHIIKILDQAQEKKLRFLLTRLHDTQYAELPEHHRARIDYEPMSRTGYYDSAHPLEGEARVAIVAAGTSDVPVSREAARTLRYYGFANVEMTDIGVAGLWRLLERLEQIRSMPVVIAVAGMDCALPTVLGGLYGGAIIAVPTSVGYGVASGGHAALHSVLSSCAPGVAVMNIDNGYGAACAAMRMVRAFNPR
ncbi:MAG TPA: nickel pincer cofactor biosynthesis protein LarB [Burkholderiales bacterium]|nr:nickel pincer cofactor biosynthesis protein LarB [Burkholderiales bacterium]